MLFFIAVIENSNLTPKNAQFYLYNRYAKLSAVKKYDPNLMLEI